MAETYMIDEFSTGAWSDKPEYSADSIGWPRILEVHKERGDLIEFGRCGGADCWYLLHMKTDVVFEYFLYVATSWESGCGTVREAEPFIWVYGTTFDGVRELSGGQNFSGNLLDMAQALRWVHADACARWPRFKEWYQ